MWSADAAAENKSFKRTLSRAPDLPKELPNADAAAELFGRVTDDNPDSGSFFGDLRLSESGGISKINKPVQLPQYFGGLLSVCLLLLNVYTVLSGDLKILRQTKAHTEKSQLLRHEIFLDWLIPGMWSSPESLIAVFELAGLAYYAVEMVWGLMIIAFPHMIYSKQAPVEQNYQRWSSAAKLFRIHLRGLQAFSAMRVLQYVTPGVAVGDCLQLIESLKRKQAQNHNKQPAKSMLAMLGFFALRIIYLFFGFEAFLVKFREAAWYLPLAATSLKQLVPILAFLNQMLGVVQLNIFTEDRLFRFVFGGVDNYIDDSELRRMNVWQAALQKVAWNTHDPLSYLVLSVTFNDSDFQSMVLEG